MSEQLEFSFRSQASDENTFDVLRFTGEEGISSLFRFEIELRSLDSTIDFDTHLEKGASFTICRGDAERKITGILSDFDALYQKGEYTIYRAVLVPILWRLTLFHTNEVYLPTPDVDNRNRVSDMIGVIMAEAGFTSLDYRFDLEHEAERQWEYRCQYNESHFNFVSRITEREGIYYYFEPDGKVVFTDGAAFSYPALVDPDLYFCQHQGIAPEHTSSLINSLVGTRQNVPAKVILRDFNDDTPSVDVRGEATVNSTGVGEVNVFGQNILDLDEASRLAKIRAEEILAKASYFHGEGDAYRLIPGYTCTLKEHFRREFNQRYCVVSIRHSGYDPRYSQPVEGEVSIPYNQEFTWLAAKLQYRPEIKTPVSEIKGTLRAIVDSETDGQYAEVDDQGRYKVILPFDRRTRGEGKASHWIRMMQTFGGENQGMHFPMRKGARVLLSFIGGDPDRPVISGAIPDAGQPSVVTGDNKTNSMIKTAAGNKIEIEDKEESNRIKLETPHESTYLHLGAPNHDGSGYVMLTRGIERVDVGGGQRLTTSVDTTAALDVLADTARAYATSTSEAAADAETAATTAETAADEAEAAAEAAAEDPGPFGINVEASVAHELAVVARAEATAARDSATAARLVADEADTQAIAKEVASTDAGSDSDGSYVYSVEATGDESEPEFQFFQKGPNGAGIVLIENEIAGGYLIERRTGDKLLWTSGSEYVYGGGNVFNFGNGYEETHAMYNDDTGESGIDNASAGMTFDGEEMDESFTIPFTAFDPEDGTYKATGMMPGAVRWDIENYAVEKVWSDTYNYQCGYNYSWGDTRDYEFGNGYAEAHNSVDDDGVPTHGKGINAGSWDHDFYTDTTGDSAEGKVLTIDAGSSAIEKSFGDSYEYANGNSLAVGVGDSEEHSWGNSYEYSYGGTSKAYSYGGRSEEYVYQGFTGDDPSVAIIVSEEWSESGTSESRHYNRNGVIDSFERSDDHGALVFSVDLPMKIPTLSMEMNLSQLNTATSVSVASTTELSIYANPLTAEFSFGMTAASLSIDLNVAALELEVTNDDASFKVPSLKIDKDLRTLSMKSEAAVQLLQSLVNLQSQAVVLDDTKVKVGSETVSLNTGLIRLFS